MFKFDESATAPAEVEWPGSGSDQPPVETSTQVSVEKPKKEPAAFIVGSKPATFDPAVTPTTGAGVALVTGVLSGIAGYCFGGWWGAGAGVLGHGAVRNGNRAYQEWRKQGNTPEATKSGTVSLLGLAGSVWMGYKAKNKRKEDE